MVLALSVTATQGSVTLCRHVPRSSSNFWPAPVSCTLLERCFGDAKRIGFPLEPLMANGMPLEMHLRLARCKAREGGYCNDERL